MHPAPNMINWRRLLVAMVAATGLLSLGVYFLFRPPPTVPPCLEVARERLELRAGKLHVPGALAPFTGQMVERYPSGALKCRSAVSNGLLEGLSVGWHTNGQKQITEWFHTNVSHGARVKWHDNGQKLSEADIVAGKIDGIFRRWHANGTLAEEIPMKEGQPDGLARSFYPGGQPKAEVRLSQGKTVIQRQWPERDQMAQKLPMLKRESDGPPHAINSVP